MSSLGVGFSTVVTDVCAQLYDANPWHFLVEALCLAIIVYLLTSKSYKKQAPLTEEEIDQIVAEWKPQPLFPTLPEEEKITPIMVEGSVGAHVKVDSKDLINFSCNDYLSLNTHDQIKDACLKALDKYGCGSCGPRGFYGTLDVHLQLEEDVAKFMGSERALIYAADIATASSTIPTFSKAGDLILCDEGASYNIQEGCKLSRSKVILFKHNDMADLEAKLKDIVEKDKSAPKKKLNRRFIVFEALYTNYGDIAPLDKLVQLKQKYRFRLIMDESHSVGVLGRKGRGLTEKYGIKPAEVDLITSSMGNALAAMGGFCCGSKQVVSHQRLAGSGYVFSASAPPYLAVAASEALKIIDKQPERVTHLQTRVERMRGVLQKSVSKFPFCKILGAKESPLVVLSLPSEADGDRLASAIHKKLLEEGVVVTVLRSCPGERRLVSGVRFNVTHDHTDADIDKCGECVDKALSAVLAPRSS